MKKRIIKLFLLLLCIVSHVNAQLITYKAPVGAALTTDFIVKVRQKGGEWKTLPTYKATVTNIVNTKSEHQTTSFAYFDFSGIVEVAVTYNKGTVEQARVRPLGFGIVPRIQFNTLSFFLDKPRNLSVEINGDILHNLQLFANPVETFHPSPADTNITYFGPGIHQVGVLKARSNQTIYLAGGAIVQGQILISKAENVRILGRGILTQLPVFQKQNAAKAELPTVQSSRNDQLTVAFSKNVEVDGIIVLPHKYSILIGQSAGVKISNFKSISFEGNADGIDVFCSSDVAISDIFMRNSDDCIAIYGHRWNYYGNTRNISVSNATLWADVAHPVLIGTHGDTDKPDTLENMTFKNIDVLEQHEHQIDYQGCIALNAGDSNLLNQLRFENIRVEDFREGQLVNIRVMFNHYYNTSPGRGIQNVYFKNVDFNGHHSNISVVAGYDNERRIKNVVFENLKINGVSIADDMPGKPGYYKTGDMANILIGEHTDGIRFIATKDK
ncbi:glycosyl hydrolase family 28 protein [Mucilaginibacter sp. OK283]|uniref:glycosyl hydrolase family 28 protein n=1 Tax=Mucilaginibacter sp. OK283 TaxID=1881049 RepID=UPI0008C6F23F|nr:glycosyl hydrolase family 28 protein [Mucilaginibacter sp. OK283]SEO72106.1 Glycosyl hydrolases family 28 [Mucilaginibacter sp. OK283]